MIADLRRLAHPPKRNACNHTLSEFRIVEYGFRHLGFKVPRRNRVHPDPVTGPLQGQGLDELLEATLHTELRTQPVTLYRDLRTVAGGVALDDDWSLFELDLLVLSLRDLRSAHILLTSAAP